MKTYVIGSLKVIPDLTNIFLSVLMERKNGIFFLVEENFAHEHLCFFFADCAEAVKFFKSVDD